MARRPLPSSSGPLRSSQARLGNAAGVPMIVVSRFEVSEQEAGGFAERAEAALTTLAEQPGFRRGRVGRSLDEPAEWVLVTEWHGVGAYRRALSAYEVRLAATPLLAQARDEPGAFEVLMSADGPEGIQTAGSDRAPDAGTAGPGRVLDTRPEAAG